MKNTPIQYIRTEEEEEEEEQEERFVDNMVVLLIAASQMNVNRVLWKISEWKVFL